ncbi:MULTISPECIES: hypothetical protein [unclassified Pseudomonas]|uniref:hypothetical protein n=1 Tax=unclassified Pseudomonas TaxID=196821 RepID=UPI002248E750|nr:hypothetical protein [Pseudomonas sp. DCB_BG]MCX2708350.1 hypothetical protein [Pseudomonas sp. DCB_BG]
MSILFTFIPAVPDNALTFSELLTADNPYQAIADYVAHRLGVDQYNNCAGLFGQAWTWLYSGYDEDTFNALIDTYGGPQAG